MVMLISVDVGGLFDGRDTAATILHHLSTASNVDVSATTASSTSFSFFHPPLSSVTELYSLLPTVSDLYYDNQSGC